MLPVFKKIISSSVEQEIFNMEKKYAAAFAADAQYAELKSIRQAIKLLKVQIGEQRMHLKHGS
jgi:putative IMPACT (imprinted ancient) family translation regulator